MQPASAFINRRADGCDTLCPWSIRTALHVNPRLLAWGVNGLPECERKPARTGNVVLSDMLRDSVVVGFFSHHYDAAFTECKSRERVKSKEAIKRCPLSSWKIIKEMQQRNENYGEGWARARARTTPPHTHTHAHTHTHTHTHHFSLSLSLTHTYTRINTHGHTHSHTHTHTHTRTHTHAHIYGHTHTHTHT